jgi:hypothetical protein
MEKKGAVTAPNVVDEGVGGHGSAGAAAAGVGKLVTLASDLEEKKARAECDAPLPDLKVKATSGAEEDLEVKPLQQAVDEDKVDVFSNLHA